MHLLNDIDGTNCFSIPFFGSFSSFGREMLVWKVASQGRRAARSSRPSVVAGWEGRRTPCARPRPAARPSGRGKHMQSTWPDLELNSDSHNHTHSHLYPERCIQYRFSTCSTMRNRHMATLMCAHMHTHSIRYVSLKYIYSSQTCMYICGCVYDTQNDLCTSYVESRLHQ